MKLITKLTILGQLGDLLTTLFSLYILDGFIELNPIFSNRMDIAILFKLIILGVMVLALEQNKVKFPKLIYIVPLLGFLAVFWNIIQIIKYYLYII